MRKAPRISDAEWQVMEAVWRRPWLLAAEVADEVGAAQGWKPNTVRTMLARLVAKGALECRDEGGRYRYRAKWDREACVEAEGSSFLNRVFGGSVDALLLHFAPRGKLSRREREKLRDVLRREEK